MDIQFFSTIVLTFKLAFTTTVILILLGLLIAYWLYFSRIKFKPIIEAIISLPLVLPPTVLGFYLLVLFSEDNIVGYFLQNHLNIKLIFTFEGIVVASVIYSLPFMVQPIYSGLVSLPKILIDAGYTIGKSNFQIFTKIMLPNIKPSILTAIILTFVHTIGEFGVVLMVGGSIPQETKVASIAIFEEVESLNYENAHIYASFLLVLSLTTLIIVYSINKKLSQVVK